VNDCTLLPTEQLAVGILFDAQNRTFDNPESTRFMAKIMKSSALGAHIVQASQSQKFGFDREKCVKYIIGHHRAMMKIQLLLHILQGLPGRMTKESLYSSINTNDGLANLYAPVQVVWPIELLLEYEYVVLHPSLEGRGSTATMVVRWNVGCDKTCFQKTRVLAPVFVDAHVMGHMQGAITYLFVRPHLHFSSKYIPPTTFHPTPLK